MKQPLRFDDIQTHYLLIAVFSIVGIIVPLILDRLTYWHLMAIAVAAIVWGCCATIILRHR
jgi:hypothetical protein